MKVFTYSDFILNETGSFYIPFSTFSSINLEGKQKKRFNHISQKGYIERYGVLKLFKKYGFKQLKEIIIEWDDGLPVVRKNRISGGFSSLFGNLDSLFSISNLISV